MSCDQMVALHSSTTKVASQDLVKVVDKQGVNIFIIVILYLLLSQ